MVRNDLLNHIHAINPIDDRLMSITLKGTVQYTFINTYMHTAQNHISNDQRYSKLNTLYKSLKNKGPTYIGGDFNARLQGKEDQGETNRLIGNHLFHPKSLRGHFHESMQENKSKLIEFV